MNLVTSFDERSYNHAVIMIKSFFKNYKNQEKINLFCFVNEDLLSQESEFFSLIDEKDRLSLKFIVSKRWSKEVNNKNAILSDIVWQKLFIASELTDIKNVLYITPNSMFQKDVDTFLKYNYFGKIAGVIDNYGMNEIIFNTPDSVYYWYDVMYADLEFWRESNFEDWVINYSKNLLINTINKENDALNIFFKKYAKPLPYHFGYMARIKDEPRFSELLSHPSLVVFGGKNKPWTDHNYNNYEISWRNQYRAIFGEDVPIRENLKNEVYLND